MDNENNLPESAQDNQSGIDWNTFDINSIPKEVLEKHAYVNALTKRIADRTNDLKQAKSTRQQQTQVATDFVTNEDEHVEDMPDNDKPEWLEQLVQRVQNITATEKLQVLAAARENAMAKFNLSKESESFLTGTSVAAINEQAARLWSLQTGKTSAANPGGSSGTTTKTQMLLDKLQSGSSDPLSNPSPLEVLGRRNR